MAPTQDRFSDQLVALHEKTISFTGMLDAVAIGVPGPVAGNTMGHSAPLGLAGSFSFSDCFPDAQHLIVRNGVNRRDSCGRWSQIPKLRARLNQHWNRCWGGDQWPTTRYKNRNGASEILDGHSIREALH